MMLVLVVGGFFPFFLFIDTTFFGRTTFLSVTFVVVVVVVISEIRQNEFRNVD